VAQGQFGNPEERGTPDVGSCDQRTVEDKVDREKGLAHAIMYCRLCRSMNCYCYL
jgi:hypothetical protein